MGVRVSSWAPYLLRQTPSITFINSMFPNTSSSNKYKFDYRKAEESIRTLIGKNDPESQNSLATLLYQFCENLIATREVKLPVNADTDELIQQAVIKFLMNGQKPGFDIKSIGNCRAYLKTIIKNNFVNNRKDKNSRALTDSDLTEPGTNRSFLETCGYEKMPRRRKSKHLLEHLVCEYGDVIHERIANNGLLDTETETVRTAIARTNNTFPGNNYDILLEDYYFGDLSKRDLVDNLAKELEKPEGTIKSRLFMGKKRLHEMLEKSCDDYNSLKERLNAIEGARSASLAAR